MKDVIDFFDPHNAGHVKAWLHKMQTGQWPLSFWKVLEKYARPPHYHEKIAEKLAMAWATHSCGPLVPVTELSPILPRSQLYRPPPERYKGMAPEQALCYEFIEEASRFGWEVYPEYPKSLFDMLLVAKEGCLTQGAEPGMQIGVQAKMSLNEDVIRQIKEPLETYRSHWKRPDFLCVLVPSKPTSGEAGERRTKMLRKSGVGLLWVYDEFRGHDNDHSVKRINLGCVSSLGLPQIKMAAKRIDLPETKIWVEPGVASPMPVTPWKISAVKACISMAKSPPKTAAEFKRAYDMDAYLWEKRGWLKIVGKRGRSQLFALADVADRPDRKYPSIYETYKET